MEQEKERLFWKGRSFRVATRGPGPGQWTEISICTTFAQGKYVAKKRRASLSSATWGL